MDLNDIIGSILSDITSARNTSDLFSRRLVKYYEQDTLLRYFPVPRAEIKDITFEIKFAIEGALIDPAKNSSKKGKISNIIEKYCDDLVFTIGDDIKRYSERNYDLTVAAEKFGNLDFTEYLKLKLVQKVEPEFRNVGEENFGTVIEEITSAVVPVLKRQIPIPDYVTFMAEADEPDPVSFEDYLNGCLKKKIALMFDEIVKVNKETNDYRVDLIVEAAKLQELPESAISKMTINSGIRNYNWKKTGEEDNQPVRKLIVE